MLSDLRCWKNLVAEIADLPHRGIQVVLLVRGPGTCFRRSTLVAVVFESQSGTYRQRHELQQYIRQPFRLEETQNQ